MCIITYYYESCQFTPGEKEVIFYTYNDALMLYGWYSQHKLGPKEAIRSKNQNWEDSHLEGRINPK